MKLLVIGHCSYDILHPGGQSEREVPGGILRAIAALAAIMSRQDRIIPVFGVSKADESQVNEFLMPFPSVDTSAIFSLEQPIHRVHYYPQPSGTTVACAREMMSPIPFDRIRRILDVDGILMNMISGFDVTLETVNEMRMAIRGQGIPLHFDFHNLTMGAGKDQERVRRPVSEWRRWAFMADTVQLNQVEIKGLSAEPMPEQQVAGHLLTLGVKGVVVTRGPEGTTLYYNEHKKVLRKDLPAVGGNGAQDIIGSGDVFGAAFLYHQVKTSDLHGALDFANRTAANVN